MSIDASPTQASPGQTGLGQAGPHQAATARARGRKVRARQAESLGRAIPASRDPEFIEQKVRASLVREAVKVIDRDPELVDWLGDKLKAAQGGPGRPGELSLRTALICFWLLANASRNFHLINLATLVDSMSWRIRRDLGIDYTDSRGHPKQVSYNQLLRVFHNMAAALDPYEEGIDVDEARQRATDLQNLCNRLLRASTADVVHSGNYAVDATLKWAHERPRMSLNSKIKRRGKDGDAGTPATLSEVIDADVVTDLEEAGLVRDPIGAELLAEEGGGRTSRYDQRTWSGGAGWVGRSNVAKSVFGYALHTATVSERTAPNVTEAMALTTAKALPAPAIIPPLRELHDVRAAQIATASGAERSGTQNPDVRALGDVVADPAYSANIWDWQLPLRALGANPIFRLHRTNQAGRIEQSGTLFIDGRPVCPCAAHAVPHMDFPKFPYTRKEIAKYQEWVEVRAAYELKPNGGWLTDGGRQFLFTHYKHDNPTGRASRANTGGLPGGCEHCLDAFGQAVIDPETGRPRPRCCTKLSKKFAADELGLYQEAGFGDPHWFELWNPRNRVEGSYGALKNLALVNWGRDYHNFVGLARESLVATFAVMALNFHTIRTFNARQRMFAAKGIELGSQAKLVRQRGRKVLAQPSAQPTMTTPQGAAGSQVETPITPSGPMGLDFLGTPHSP
jgi:hypothetical protein